MWTCHNHYQEADGENAIFADEDRLLKRKGLANRYFWRIGRRWKVRRSLMIHQAMRGLRRSWLIAWGM